jgi:hypothetical protein
MYTSRGETCRTEVNPEQGYVLKQFVPRKTKYGKRISDLRQSLDLCMYREIECLERLENSKHFPKIISHDSSELWIKMTYVGEHLVEVGHKDPDVLKAQVPDIVRDLVNANIKLAYEWSPGDEKIGYCNSMMMVKDNLLSLIDFERAWPVGCVRENEFNDIFKNSFIGHNNNNFQDVLLKTISTIHEKK